MSEATDFHPRPPSAAPPRRARGVLRPDRPIIRGSYPLDRLWWMMPHAPLSLLRIALRHRFPRAQVGDDPHAVLRARQGEEPPSRELMSPYILL